MQNRSISLPVGKKVFRDSEGFPKEQWQFMKGIRASFISATRQDEILANQCGYEATIIVEIAACAYNGASFFVDEATGDIYDIKRSYQADKTRTVKLTGERRERGEFLF